VSPSNAQREGSESRPICWTARVSLARSPSNAQREGSESRRDIQQHPLDPDWEFLQRVMAEAGDVVDANKTSEDADPYVLALGLQLAAAGYDVEVVTEDRVDRNRIAMTTACRRLKLPHCSVRDFFGQLGVKTRNPAEGNDRSG
jgi:hypothetical protein